MFPPLRTPRLHSEYSVVDGIVRLDDASRPPPKRHGRARADRSSRNAFGLIRFYKEARGGNVKPVVALTSG
jgi:DNA polymerase-3 subunit alpha